MKTWKPTPVHLLGAAVLSSVGFGTLLWGPHENKDLLLLGHRYWVSTAAFTPDGKGIVSGAGDHDLSSEAKLWSLASNQARALLGHTGSVEAIAFSPNGSQLATGGYDQMIRLWDVRKGYQPICTLPGHDGAISLLAYSRDGRTLISAGNDRVVKFWDVVSCTERLRLEGQDAIALSPQTDSFATRENSANSLTIRELATGAPRQSLAPIDRYTMCGVFSPDGHLFAAGGFDWSVCVYQLDGSYLSTFLKGHQDYIIALAFSPDGRTLASACQDRTVKIWDVSTGREIRTLVGHTGPVTSVAFAPDGKRLVSGSYDKTVRVWNMEAIN